VVVVVVVAVVVVVVAEVVVAVAVVVVAEVVGMPGVVFSDEFNRMSLWDSLDSTSSTESNMVPRSPDFCTADVSYFCACICCMPIMAPSSKSANEQALRTPNLLA
jgi:hypothetical protein